MQVDILYSILKVLFYSKISAAQQKYKSILTGMTIFAVQFKSIAFIEVPDSKLKLCRSVSTLEPLSYGPQIYGHPAVRSVWPCALNTVQFAADPGSKSNPCERWQGALFIGVLT